MYVQVGGLAVVGDCSTVPLTQISCNTVFSKSQNARKAETLCNGLVVGFGSKGMPGRMCNIVR